VSRLEENILKICLYESVDLREAVPAAPVVASEVPTVAAAMRAPSLVADFAKDVCLFQPSNTSPSLTQ